MTSDLLNKIESIISRNPQANDRDILLQLRQLLTETELQYNVGIDAKSITDLVTENIQQFKGDSYQDTHITSGFAELDKLIGGFRLGEFVVVGGRPSIGKTQFLINLSLHISETIPTLYATLDLSEFLLTNRFISSVSEIPTQNILQHDLDEEQKNKLLAIGDAFTKRKLFIHDTGNSFIESLKALIQKQIQENGIQVIFVDYLQLISSCHHRKSRETEVSHICRELKNLAKEKNVCLIAASQLSRAVELRGGVESKRPILSDLRESGAIEQDADKVLFVHCPEYYGVKEDAFGNSLINLAEIIVAKNRNGRLGSIYLCKDKDFTNFRTHIVKDDFTFSANRLLEFGDMNF